MYQEYLNFVDLSSLSSDELKDLLNDDEKLDEKVEQAVTPLKNQKESLLTDNRTKAEKNIEKEPQLIELRSKLIELRDEAKNSCTTVQEKLALVNEKSGGVETALALLQAAAAESEEGSEALNKQFTDNEINADAFLEGFLSSRKTMHLRKLKVEKMQELIRRGAQRKPPPPAAGAGVAYGGGYSNLPSSGFFPTPSVPYPLGPMMPMPPPRPY